MKKFILILLIPLLAFTFTGNPPGWYELALPINDQVNDIYFTDSLNGWIVTLGDNSPPDTGYILHTSDGGSSWEVQFSHAGDFAAIQFLDNNTGYAYGFVGFTRFYKTTDGGANWTDLSAGIPIFGALRGEGDMQFINQDTGWICSRASIGGGLAKTTNGGLNWVQQLGQSFLPKKLFFVNENIGWTLGSGNNLYHTVNGGGSWFVQYGFNNPLEDIFFVNDTLGFVSGSFVTHSLKRTTNGGAAWDSTYNSVGGIDIYFVDQLTGYTCSNLSTLQKSTDGGISWYNQNVPSGNYLSLCFLDTLLGFVGGTKILKTTDGGGPISSIQPISNEIPEGYWLYQNYPNPFNPTTNIKFKIKHSGSVKLSIYDITGKEVDVLVSEELSPGEYEYKFDGTGLSSGIYFYRIQTKVFTDIKKMILVK